MQLIIQALLAALAGAAIGALCYFALSKKSSPFIRRAALAGLFLAGLSIMVCSLMILFLQPGPAGGISPALKPEEKPVKPAAPADWKLLVALAVAALIFVVIIVSAARREKRGPGIRPGSRE